MNRDQLLMELASTIAEIHLAHPVRVAIDGVDASGKSTLADALDSPLVGLGRHVIRASIDGFHNPKAIRSRRGELSPEGYFHDSFNYAALIHELLEPLGPGGSRYFRRAIFDYRSDTSVESQMECATPNAVLLFDGVFLLRHELRSHWDFSIFVRADFDVTINRAATRDVDLFGDAAQVRQRYDERYVPGQQLYFSAAQPEQWASVVIDNNDPEHPTIVLSPG